MNGVIGQDSALQGYTGPGQPGLMRQEFCYESCPSAGLFKQPVDQQSNVLPLCYGCPKCDPYGIFIKMSMQCMCYI